MDLDKLSKAKILIAGDVMLDQYWMGDSSRISPEAPVPIINIKDVDNRLGGAANVAMNVQALGASATLVGVVGEDENAEILKALIKEANINSKIITNDSFKTLTKLRAVSRNQQLLRLDFETEDHDVDLSKVINGVKNLVSSHDAIIISDYGKGTVESIAEIVSISKEKNKKIIIDPKGYNYDKYFGASIITPNYSEFIQVVGQCKDEKTVKNKASDLCDKLKLDALLITRSEKGMSLFFKDGSSYNFPTVAKEVYDVTGAGDTVVALLASSLAVDYSVIDAVKVANLGAGVAVSKFGTASVTINELKASLYTTVISGKHMTNLEELKSAVIASRQNNESIVFTNGCFDLLHHGHVACLQDAKSRGDRLIVAVNDDNSIRRLKGNSRPVCQMHNRIAVLEELNCIDWIVSFSDDTPMDLIKVLQPDVYVKGGDYNKKELPEYKLVTSYGGEVVISPYIEGCSTTTIIESLSNSE